MRENADIKDFFGCNNTSTVGIVNTLLKEERTDVVLVGFDLADETKQMLQNPEYHAVTVLQKQDQMGYLGMLSLNSLIKGENQSRSILIPESLWLILITLWRMLSHERSKKK